MTDQGRVKVPPELADTGPMLGVRAAQLTEELSTLRRQVVELSQTWKGDARDKYNAYQAQWDAAASELFGEEGILGSLARTMTTVNINYAEAELDNMRGWST